MAVRIRLQRKGARHMAFYRIVVADSRSPRDGRFVEQLGYYDPLTDPADIKVDTEKVIEWLGKGAQPSETVKSLFSRIGIMETWHHVRQGKSLDEVRHIEEDARKRVEAQAAMDRRKKDEAKATKKVAAKAEAEEPTAEDAGTEATVTEEEATEPAAGPQKSNADAGGEEAAETPEKAPAAEETPVAEEQAEGGPEAGAETVDEAVEPETAPAEPKG